MKMKGRKGMGGKSVKKSAQSGVMNKNRENPLVQTAIETDSVGSGADELIAMIESARARGARRVSRASGSSAPPL